ncbi:MAG: ABC transporter substrate-binding protein [Thalassobium sp.]|nr:MAG: ABC transporter substrate-binding protein [Thalassobium sp.]|tara:strand:- start:855 stop:2771 length:1917 start_codon:yes stop_codon:yes gene_type:complete
MHRPAQRLPRTRVAFPAKDRTRLWFTGTAIMIGGVLWAHQALADSHETIITSHGFSNFGELAYPADFTQLDYVNPDAPKGGEIAIWAQGTFDSMNPFATQRGTPGRLSSIPYERVMTATADEVGSAYCLLCETIEYPESQDWVIFNMRRDVIFSDGTPMTAQDMVFSHELLRDEGTPSYGSYVKQVIASVEALDDYTVKFVFAEGIPRKGLISLVGSTPVWSEAWYEETGAKLDESRFEISPGTGPYMLDSYDAGRRIVYRRNPDYWGADHPLSVGHYNFDTIRVEYFADTTTAFEAFKSGEYTFRQENSSLTWATGYDFPALTNEWVVQDVVPVGTVPNATGFLLNLRNPKFDDVRVREALGLMYNFTWTNDTLQYGLFQQRESFWQGSALAATGVPEGRELELLQTVADLIDPSLLTDPAVTPHTSGERQLDRGNLRAALALMEDAGWVAGDDGMLRNAAGEAFTLEFLSVSPSFDRIIMPYIDNLKRLGVDAVYNRVDPAQYQLRSQTFDYEMIYDGYTSGLEEGSGLGQKYGSEDVDDVFNPAGFSHPAVDALIDFVEGAESYDEMAAGVRAIDRIMRAERFITPAWYLGNRWLAYYDMFERPEELPPYAIGELDFWWYNAEKADELRAVGALR